MKIFHLSVILLFFMCAYGDPRNPNIQGMLEKFLKNNKASWKQKHTNSIVTSADIKLNILSTYELKGIMPGQTVTGVDCADILKKDPSTKNQDGVFTINPNNTSQRKVFCDMTTKGGGWTQYFDTCGASCSTNRCCVSTATGPKCVKSDCPFNHPDANDTTVKVTSTKIGTTLFYTCNCNQSITLTSTCNADGAWTSSASYCNPRFEVTGADCADILKKDICTKNQDGVYTINPNNSSPKKVFCDMTTSGGGWTVIQNRIDGSIEFYRTWNDYKEGFGNSSKNYWIGNDMIHILTRNKTQKLRIELQRFSGEKGYAEYSTVTVFDETNKYMLNVSGFSGNIGDSLNNHNSMKFSTWDQDNDRHSMNCAQYHHGAWWYNTCYHSNLNGKYMNSSISSDDKSNNWGLWGISYEPMKTTRMMIRPGNL